MANSTIPNLPLATVINGTDLFIVDNGVLSQKAPLTLLQSSIPSLSPPGQFLFQLATGFDFQVRINGSAYLWVNETTSMNTRGPIALGSALGGGPGGLGTIRLPSGNAMSQLGWGPVGSELAGIYTDDASGVIRFGTYAAGHSQFCGYDNFLNSFAGNTCYDNRNAITTDMCVVSQSLLNNYTNATAAFTATNLNFAVNANEVWEVEWFLTAQSAGGAPGMQYEITAPVGSVVEGWLDSSLAALTTKSYQRITAPNTANATPIHTISATPGLDIIRARVKMGANAGTLGLSTQCVIAANTVTVFAGSFMRARRLTEV